MLTGNKNVHPIHHEDRHVVEHMQEAQLAASFPDHDEDGVKKIQNLDPRRRSLKSERVAASDGCI